MSQLKRQIDEALASVVAPGAPFELIDCPRTGIGSKQYRNAPKNIVELFAPAKEYGKKEFVLYDGEHWSFEKILQQAASIGLQLLEKHGVRKGTRVAIAMRNYPEWMTAFIGITCVGAVVVPLNSWGTTLDLEHGLTDSNSKFLFCDPPRYDMMKNCCADKDIVPIVVRAQANDLESNAFTYEDFIAEASHAKMPDVNIAGDDDVLIMYTSGTTGKAKGALSTHHALCQAIFSMECMGAAMAIGNREPFEIAAGKGFAPCSLMTIPLFHVGGCHAQFLTAIRSGSRIVMMHKWDVNKAFDYLEKEQITLVGGAPAQILDFLNSPRLQTSDLSSLSMLVAGGSATPPKVHSLLNEKLPHHMLGVGWAMTETNSVGVIFSGVPGQSPAGSSGICHPIVELSIRDEQGDELPSGENGEIWIRSVALITCYWNRPEANAKDFSAGWFNSGDIGHVSEDGFLYLADRAKDMIIRGGENIYPVEIENCLLEHPGMHECAVFGSADERMGEEVAVVVVSKPGIELSEAMISCYAKEHLAAYKVPTRIILSDHPLPRNPTNKILKNVVREQFDQH
jgi:long-chain acyl-CoA synthetase